MKDLVNFMLLLQLCCGLGETCVLLMYEMYWLQDLIRDVDPDIIIGYNICKFDLPYLIEVLEH